MNNIVMKTALAAALACLPQPLVALAQDVDGKSAEPEYARPVGTIPEGPMGHVGPGDMLTTPEQRARLDREQQNRMYNPDALDKQNDKVERDLGLNGRR